MFSSARIGWPAATWPIEREAALADDGLHRIHHPAGRLVEHLDRPRLGRVPPQQPGLLEVGEVGMHRRGRRQPDGLADVPHGRRIAVLARVLLDEVEDLLLALRQVLADVHPIGLLGQIAAWVYEHVFADSTAPRWTDSRPPVQPPARRCSPSGQAPLPLRPRTVGGTWPPKPPPPRRSATSAGAPSSTTRRSCWSSSPRCWRPARASARSPSTSARPRSGSARARATTAPPASSRSSSPRSRSTTPRCSCARSRAGSSS